MKVKATWISINPFIPDFDQLGYSKTIDIPDNSNLEEIERFARKDSINGYRFDKLEILNKTETNKL